MERISRRKMLQCGSAVLVAGSLPPSMWPAPFGRVPGIQLYTVAEPLQKDVDGTLQKISAIGYREVETAGFANRTAKEFRQSLNKAELRCHSCHMHLNVPDLGPVFEDAKTVGAEYVVSSTLLPPRDGANAGQVLTLDDYKKMAGEANRVAEKAKGAGLQYAYHNHDYEFRPQANGQTGYDLLLSETDPSLVKFELDCGWMLIAGHSPVEYFRRYPGRYRMIHIKNYLKPAHGPKYNGEMQGTEIGKGCIDYRPILTAARNAGIEYSYVEQEPPFLDMTSLQAAAADFRYLRGL